MNRHEVRVSYRVPYADTDQMGIVYYGNYLVYFERARNELLRSLGFTYAKMEARGLALPVLTAHVDYKAAAHYDDMLEIRGCLGEHRAVRLRVDCSVYRGDTLLASGHTVHASVNRETMRPVRMPADIATVFRNALAEEAT